MGSKKHISVNLRDLQRVLNKEEDELLNTSTENNTKFGATKNFEYKLSNNRWENEDNDDDFDIPGVERKVPPEPDFSTLRRPVGRSSPGLKPQSSSSPLPETSTTNELWRPTETAPSADTDSSWRASRTVEDSKTTNSEFRTGLNRGMQIDELENNKKDEGKKPYVPRYRREASPSSKNDRFSCLEEPRDNWSPTRNSAFRDSRDSRDGGPFSRYEQSRRDSRSPPRETRARDDWGIIEKPREDRGRDDNRSRPNAFSSETPLSSQTNQESSKKGLFVPSYRKNLKKEDTVEDLFMKAAGLTSVPEKDKHKKDTDGEKSNEPQENKVLLAKRNEILKHNTLFKCSSETVDLVEEYVLSLINSDDKKEFPDFTETESIVPLVVTCIVVAKNCENCKTLDQVKDKFKRVRKWLLHSVEGKEPRKLLTELVKSANHWGYPSLSDSVYLVEALFDSLYNLGVINKEEFLDWFENDVDEIPNRVTLLLQLMNWKKWLNGESFEDPVEEESEYEEESGSEDEDSDIEANVPKPTRLTKAVRFK